MGCAPFDTALEPCALWVSCLECGVPSVGVKGISRQVCLVVRPWKQVVPQVRVGKDMLIL